MFRVDLDTTVERLVERVQLSARVALPKTSHSGNKAIYDGQKRPVVYNVAKLYDNKHSYQLKFRAIQTPSVDEKMHLNEV